MNSPVKWTILDTFSSEAEARVVESFLNAQGFEVQLLDTHMHRLLPAHGAGDFGGMRLMVRAEHMEEARAALQASRRPTHLDVAEPTSLKLPVRSASKIIWTAVVFILVASTLIAVKFF